MRLAQPARGQCCVVLHGRTRFNPQAQPRAGRMARSTQAPGRGRGRMLMLCCSSPGWPTQKASLPQASSSGCAGERAVRLECFLCLLLFGACWGLGDLTGAFPYQPSLPGGGRLISNEREEWGEGACDHCDFPISMICPLGKAGPALGGSKSCFPCLHPHQPSAAGGFTAPKGRWPPDS